MCCDCLTKKTNSHPNPSEFHMTNGTRGNARPRNVASYRNSRRTQGAVSWVRLALVSVVVIIICGLFKPVNVIAQCGCLDIALVIDNTGSMGGAIDNVRSELTNIIASAQLATGGDLRMGLITFPDDNVVVSQPFTPDIAQISDAVNAIPLGFGGSLPESSDASLQYVVSGAAYSGCTVVSPSGPLGQYREDCGKIAILVTDASPGGCHDSYTDGIDDVNAAAVAANALTAGVHISAVLIGSGSQGPSPAHPSGVENDVMKTYATVTGGVFTNSAANGLGTAAIIQDIIDKCGGILPGVPPTDLPTTKPAAHPFCITRNARYWFSRPTGDSENCATLLKAIQVIGFGGTNGFQSLPIGFMGLPQEYRNADNLKDSIDATIEALGFYWRGLKRTGESNGTQGAQIRASALCTARKQLTAELIAAQANNWLLGTGPQNCTYTIGDVTTNFPPDLIELAGNASVGEAVEPIRVMTVLLQKFNGSGQTNLFLNGLQECTPADKKSLKSVSRDATTIVSCPGFNDYCETADPITSFPFKRSVDFRKYTGFFIPIDLGGGTNGVSITNIVVDTALCGVAGRDAFWKITPEIAIAGSHFTVNTFDSNFDTTLAVFQGVCGSLRRIDCNNNYRFPEGYSVLQSKVEFTADGESTYYIKVIGNRGTTGKMSLRVTSP